MDQKHLCTVCQSIIFIIWSHQKHVRLVIVLCSVCLFVQILFVSGLSFVIGLERTFRFFFQRHKAKATSFFLGGVFVVLIGWPIIGVVLEIYGFFLLFRSAKTQRNQSLCYCQIVMSDVILHSCGMFSHLEFSFSTSAHKVTSVPIVQSIPIM